MANDKTVFSAEDKKTIEDVIVAFEQSLEHCNRELMTYNMLKLVQLFKCKIDN